MNYQETVDYLYSKLPMFSREGKVAFKEKLTNIRALCDALGNPQKNLRYIHIAGTNGKGSTSHMIAAILQQAGYKTGLYTSPHLFSFRERIKLNGECIPESFVVEFVKEIQPHIDTIQPSFFEITVAMAFSYFKATGAEVCVLETGLGGRYDSTNIIEKPDLTIVTHVGYDHLEILGNNLPAIAREKAGIAKNGAPLLIGEFNEETRLAISLAALEVHAHVFYCQDFIVLIGAYLKNGLLYCDFFDKFQGERITLATDLTGMYQCKNLRTVLCGLEFMRKAGYKLSEEAIRGGLKNIIKLTGLRGRWETIQQNPTVILDVAHNKDGIREVLNNIDFYYPDRQIHFILGFVKDKHLQPILDILPSTGKYYFTEAHIARALPRESLKSNAYLFHLQGEAYEDVNIALEAAKSQASKEDVIIITGSFFIISELAPDVLAR